MTSPPARPLAVGILVFDEVEVLDACGPFEVFSVAARPRVAATGSATATFTVVLIAASRTTTRVRARGGLVLTADHTLSDAPELDLLIVPGGVTTAVETDADVIAWIAQRRTTPTLASVCTGAFLLAVAGVLTDQEVTTHWEDQAELAQRFPALRVTDRARWVGGDGLYTSAGISAGLDLSLHLVATLSTTAHAEATAHQMDYAWRR
ncbi:DJ-1/PfpI family protein [Serinibacter arcticus]|uniref:ThiJ/PfpI family protein n=1 Tax=Serinibacter arcticus TaxID=1655435 RepID=A0A4Z1E0Y3_9MICO|nr:DJ-1/PfpI family protein [Serinibacter arcticus]TGO04332.1 ThiJ/PfpI family protein [Serinibacter arcticus]